MAVWALGINHTTAPLDLRGRFAFALDQIGPTLSGLRQSLARQPEAALISTCNRTEIYCAGDSSQLEPTLDWLAHSGGVSSSLLRSHAYTLEDSLAARHAFRVASGLDSMVLGEAQILGQLKQAVRGADEAGTLGTTLHQLFQRSFSVAKEVRSATEIGSHSISMAAAAVRLAAQLFEDLGQLRVLFVGAGEMVDLVATHFAARRPKAMAVANRTLERGEKLATRLGAQPLRLAVDYPVEQACRETLRSDITGGVEAGGKGRRGAQIMELAAEIGEQFLVVDAVVEAADFLVLDRLVENDFGQCRFQFESAIPGAALAVVEAAAFRARVSKGRIDDTEVRHAENQLVDADSRQAAALADSFDDLWQLGNGMRGRRRLCKSRKQQEGAGERCETCHRRLL